MNIEFVITTHQHNLFYLIIALFYDPEHFLFLWRKNFLFGTEKLWAIFALQSFLIQDCRLSKMDFHSLMKKKLGGKYDQPKLAADDMAQLDDMAKENNMAKEKDNNIEDDKEGSECDSSLQPC